MSYQQQRNAHVQPHLRQQVQNQRNVMHQPNCVTFQGAPKFNVHYKTLNHDDRCYVDVQTRQSLGPGNYTTTNLFDCECLAPTTVRNATDNVMVNYRNGHDVSGCVVDDSSRLRIGAHRRFPRCPQQLFTRPYGTVPYMGRGPGNMHLESQLAPGESTTSRRSCNTLSGASIPHVFTPLVPHLDYNVQNPVHIVEEVADEGWVRGGANTKLFVRDVDYAARCGYAYMDRETNKEFWSDRHRYL